jgi:Domain of unknown function (DUF4105)
MILALLLIFLFSPDLEGAVENIGSSPPAKLHELAQSPEWLHLGHYRDDWLGGKRSEIAESDFFISPEGRTDPEKELRATWFAFLTPPSEGKEGAVCRFPARFRWLSQQRILPTLPPVFCPKYSAFLESTTAQSVSVVFTSYYLNNPSSSFGHTLLRLNKAPSPQTSRRFELLDNGFNYSAVVTTENPFLYFLYGLFGGFEGRFTRLPYYYKVREYNDFETRDLWEYDLSLDQEQVDLVVAHLWELEAAKFQYYYLNQNCAYQILALLDVALPHADLADKLPVIVVPAETIRVLAAVPGLVREIHYRPSIRAQFNERLARLESDERMTLKNIVDNRSLAALSPFSPEKKASVLDAAIDYVDLSHFKELLAEPEGQASQWKQTLLVSRSQVPLTSSELSLEAPKEDYPHVGHGIMRTGVDYGSSPELQQFVTAHFRVALHDLLDPAPGYPKEAQIEFFNTRLRANLNLQSLWLEDFNLIKVVSLVPLQDFQQQLTWKVKVGALTIRDSSCDHCLAGEFEAGGGISQELFKGGTAFLTGDVEVALSPKFVQALCRLGSGPSLGLRFSFLPSLNALLSTNYRYQLFTPAQNYLSFSGEIRWGISLNSSITLRSVRYPDAWEQSLGWYFYL